MHLNSARWLGVLAATGIALGISGCEDLSLKSVATWLSGEKPETRPSPSPSPSPSDFADGLSTDVAQRAKANGELLAEVFKVVFQGEPRDRAEFGSLVDSMNQGASLEGVYNGLVHSADYRELEKATQGASALAIEIFGKELAILEMELLPTPNSYTTASAQPLAEAVQPGVGPSKAVTAGAAAVVATEGDAKNLSALAERYSKLFVGSSLYTLKRVLGDAAIGAMETKREYREKFALWYSKWLPHFKDYKVDFGVPLRNTVTDEAFHYKWAVTAPPDRLKWEVLNRLHRVLNDANRPKQ